MDPTVTPTCVCNHGKDVHYGGAGECGSVSGPRAEAYGDGPRFLCSCSSFRWVLDEWRRTAPKPSLIGRILGWFR